MEVNKIINEDCLTGLRKLPEKVISCCVTSPPYWSLRDYGVEGQLGLEPTFDEFVIKLCDIFDEVKRVLRDDGTCWVNLGDTYFGGGTGQDKSMSTGKYVKDGFKSICNALNARDKDYQYPAKSLTMVPFRFAIEMVNRGWILRNVIIWHKPNCMPSSIKDRFTVDFEYMFFFTKEKKYWFEMQREPHKLESLKRVSRDWNGHREKMASWSGMDISKMCHPDGRNKRTVWEINPQPFSEAHFATYPEELIETPIKAGCPPEICTKCGQARVKIMQPTKEYAELLGKGWHDHKSDGEMGFGQQKRGFDRMKDVTNMKKYEFAGYEECDCKAGFRPGIVLDPFMGAGTSALVALKQHKDFIGFEINKEYIEIAMNRIKPWLEQTSLADFK